MAKCQYCGREVRLEGAFDCGWCLQFRMWISQFLKSQEGVDYVKRAIQEAEKRTGA